MSWPDAQKWAKKKAKEDGEDYVYVMENESVDEAEDTIGGLNKMAHTDLERIADYADMIKDRMSQGQTLDAWMYSKISDSVKNLNSVHDTMDGNDGVVEAKSFGAKEIMKELKNSGDWGDLADQVYMKSGNMVFVDTFFYGEERAMKQLEDSWKKGGNNYDYWNKEYGVDFKIVDTFSEIKAQGRHKKLTKDGIVGVVLKVTPGKISESVVNEGKGAEQYFGDLKYNYTKSLRYLDKDEKKEYNKLAKDFFSKI